MAGRGAKLGMEEMGALLAQWRMAEAEVTTADVSGADAPGARTVARDVAAGPGMDGRSGGTSPRP